jgi:Flp pilus assembly pilin Flp
MIRVLATLWSDENGATSIEYALLLGALAVGTVSGVLGLAERMAHGLDAAMQPMASSPEAVHVAGVVK